MPQEKFQQKWVEIRKCERAALDSMKKENYLDARGDLHKIIRLDSQYADAYCLLSIAERMLE